MNGAYEFYDYGDLIFGLESSSSIHFTEKSRDNINNKYLEEYKKNFCSFGSKCFLLKKIKKNTL